MIISITTTIVSTIVLSVLILNKQREIQNGKAWFKIGKESTDNMVRRMCNLALDVFELVHPSKAKFG